MRVPSVCARTHILMNARIQCTKARPKPGTRSGRGFLTSNYPGLQLPVKESEVLMGNCVSNKISVSLGKQIPLV